MRNLLLALLLTGFSSLFAQQTTPAPTEQKNAIIDTAKLRVLKDSINNKFKQFFDVDMLIKCVQVRQISNVKGFSLLKKNQPLADTISLFEKGYGANIFVNSYVNSDQLWPKVFGNKDKITNLIDDKKNMPAVGFDIRFTPHGNGKDRVFNVDILNKSSEGLLDANKQSILQQVTQKGLSKPFDKVSPYAKDSVNNAMFLGIDALRGMIEDQATQCNIAHVTFEACTNQKYGFDVLPHNILTSYYEELNIKGSKYEVPWKSVAANMPDCVTAKLVLLNKNAPTHEIKFRSTNTSMVVTPNPDDGTYQISFTGGSNKSEETIDAYYTETLLTGKEKETVVGKLKLISYAPETKKLVPVLLNNVNFSCNEAELQKVLNNIYKQAAVNWTVGTPIKRDVKSWDKDNDGKLLIETSPFSRYSKEMDAIIDAIKTDPETYYVIITNIPNTQGYAGYMPLKSDFAFFFTSPSGGGQEGAYQTIAHELGHGAFYLKHINDEYKINDASDNLMNRYAAGTTLWKPQWDWIGDPSLRSYMFQKEDEGACLGEDFLSQALRAIRTIRCSKAGGDQTVNLFFHSSDFLIPGKSLASEFNWLVSDEVRNEKIRFQFIGSQTNFSYEEDVFNLSKLNFDDSKKCFILPGNRCSLYISAEDDFSNNRDKVYQFIKDIFDLNKSTTPKSYDFSKALSVLAYSKCELETQLKIQRRKEILLEISDYLSISDKEEKAVITILVTTPEKDKALLYDFLKTNPAIFAKLYEGIDDYQKEFITAAYVIWLSQNESSKAIQASLILKQVLSPGYFKYPSIVADGNQLKFSSQELYLGGYGNAYPGQTLTYGSFDYFTPVSVTFQGKFATNLAGKPTRLPAFYVRYLLDKEYQNIKSGAFNISLNVGLMVLTVGDVIQAVKLFASAGKWLPKVVNLSFTSANLTSLGLSTACINSNSEFCKAWKEYETYVNLGLITAQSLPYLKNILFKLKENRTKGPNFTAAQNKELDEILEGLDDVAKTGDNALNTADIAKLRANNAAHTIDRHGYEVTDDLLKRRATEGIAPDGSSIPKNQGGQRIGNIIPPMSSKFQDAASMKKALAAVDESTEAYRNALAAKRISTGTNNPPEFSFQVHFNETIGYGYKKPLGANNYVLTGQKIPGEPIRVDGLKKVEVRYKLNSSTNKYEINTMFPIE